MEGARRPAFLYRLHSERHVRRSCRLRNGRRATIRDTARELWSRVSDEDAIFLVTSPRGEVIASLGGMARESLPRELPVVRQALPRFPRRLSGFLARDGRLYYIADHAGLRADHRRHRADRRSGGRLRRRRGRGRPPQALHRRQRIPVSVAGTGDRLDAGAPRRRRGSAPVAVPPRVPYAPARASTRR